jgi:hypothetical protein
MKTKLKITSYLIILTSLIILGSLLYNYNDRLNTINHIDSRELNKEIFISLLTLSIGSVLLYKSKRLKE